MMAKRNDSIAALMKIAGGNPKIQIALQFLSAARYSTFVKLVNRAVDIVLAEMAQNPELRKHKGEDQLTIELVSMLGMMSIDASHDTKIGGHVDVRVRHARGYSWLAEAKRHKDYPWLFKGFQQLSTRYSTGLPDQDRGGLIIYFDRPRMDILMGRWKSHLSKKQKRIQFRDCPLNPLAFESSHLHERTGLPYTVRHIPLSVHFDPKDKKRKK